MNKRTLKGITGLLISTMAVFLIIQSREIDSLEAKNCFQEDALFKAHEDISSLEKDIMILKESEQDLKSTLDKYDEFINTYETLKINHDTLSLENEELKENNVGLKLYIQKKLGINIESAKKVTVEITKYTDEEGYWALDDPRLGTMASGRKTYLGAVAMPRNIPFGTEVIIEYDNYPSESNIVYTTEDRGGAIIEKEVDGKTVYKMDIWTDNCEEASKWGVHKDVDAYLYDIKE